MARLLSLAAVLALAPGCLAYNEECSRYMTDPDGVTGWLGGDVSITKVDVRTADNSVGQLVAEAYYAAFDDKKDSLRPDVGVVNGGGIRADGVCQTRTSLPQGAVKRKVLRDVLPFDNTVLAVTLTHHQLKNVLEHAVASYSTTNPPGSFLQVYGLEYGADCNLSAEKLDANGQRVEEGHRITSLQIKKRDGSSVAVADPPSDTETVRVGLDSFVAGGGDGFGDFKALDPNAPDRASAGGYNFEIVARYFAKTYPEASPLPGRAAPRATLVNCK
jgi:2',3'-cyclic-nucleotide 2'-phosphodiesterase (5'-nucleotidase family)